MRKLKFLGFSTDTNPWCFFACLILYGFLVKPKKTPAHACCWKMSLNPTVAVRKRWKQSENCLETQQPFDFWVGQCLKSPNHWKQPKYKIAGEGWWISIPANAFCPYERDYILLGGMHRIGTNQPLWQTNRRLQQKQSTYILMHLPKGY